ncbi:MAG: DUF362 domain-containing protein [Desulfobacteraceae bacterium]|nr:DUF362 domain-containing protein [Desulfobacteraceae bacterium]MCF8095831.1 DUF362 domain-containing protein [Desulfobacteraceae bacterium]
MKKIGRRMFLIQAQRMFGLAGASLLFPPALWAQQKNTDIAVVKGDIEPAVKKAVKMLGGIDRFVKNGSRVVIKPNMSFDSGPERASNTHPAVVKTLAEMCRKAGAGRVLVLDNPLRPAEQCIENSGIGAACSSLEKGMAQTVTDSSRFSEVEISNGKSLKKTEVIKEVLNADVLIAAPVAKSHSGAGVSLSMKGMMGLIYNRRVMHRLDLHESIADLASLLTPQLTVIDASRVLSTAGPGGPGKVLTPETIIASADMVAADAYAVSAFEWYGGRYNPDQIKHIRLAHQRKLGRMDIGNLKIDKTTV